jgi:hypothetical protein
VRAHRPSTEGFRGSAGPHACRAESESDKAHRGVRAGRPTEADIFLAPRTTSRPGTAGARKNSPLQSGLFLTRSPPHVYLEKLLEG